VMNSYPFPLSSEEFKDKTYPGDRRHEGSGNALSRIFTIAQKNTASPKIRWPGAHRDRLVRDTKAPIHDGTQLLLSHSSSARV
jgi:hypothetical protein